MGGGIMTVEDMKRLKKERGYSYAQMSELSGVPLGTIQKIFSGETSSPRYDTLQQLERIFTEFSYYHADLVGSDNCVREEALYAVDKQGHYTIDDYRALPDDQI